MSMVVSGAISMFVFDVFLPGYMMKIAGDKHQSCLSPARNSSIFLPSLRKVNRIF